LGVTEQPVLRAENGLDVQLLTSMKGQKQVEDVPELAIAGCLIANQPDRFSMQATEVLGN
jgi:hypothetical protein